ncbi:MAG: ABC transporter substrate-binding protein, partial [Hyphomicrobiales bacterium]
MPALRTFVLALLALLVAVPASAHELTLALQATGTAKWELAAMQALGLDQAHDLVLTVRDVADSRAGQIALQAGEADVILSDFVWVSLQRHHGAAVSLVPHSLSVGGLVVDPAAGIAALADLKGKTIAVSGSPVDKSYVVLAAAYRDATGAALGDDANVRFGAPPLVNELITSGQAQAALNLWNWNARAKLAGKTELVSIPALLTGLGLERTPPLLGWAFFADTGKTAAITAFLDASFDTKAALLADDALWDTIRAQMNVGDDDALFAQLRDGYRAGIVTSYGPADIEAAARFFALVA